MSEITRFSAIRKRDRSKPIVLMSWSRASTTAAVLVACLSMAPLAACAGGISTAAPAADFVVDGKITEHSPGRLTISTEANIIFHARYDGETVIKRRDGSAGSPKDLRIGEKIKIEGDLTESGEIIAQKIELEQDTASGQR